MPPPARGLPWLVALALVAPPAAPPALQAPRETRDRMEASLDGAERFLVVYGTRDSALAPLLRQRAHALARRFFMGDSAAVEADRDAPAGALARRSVFLLGGPRDNEWTRRLAPALPVTFAASSFRWQGTDYDRPGDALHLVWPNPLEPGRFLLLVAGNSLAAMVRPGAGMIFGTEDWRIYRDGELVRSGVFAQSTERPWRYDPALDRDLEALRERSRLSMRPTGSGPIRMWSAPGTPGAGAVLGAAEALVRRLDRMGFTAPGAPVIPLAWYPSLEAKGELTRITRPEHLDEAGGAHAALPAGRAAPDLWSVAAARLRRLGGAADSPWLAPTCIWLCGRAEGEPFERTVCRLYFGRLLPRAAEVATRPPSPPKGSGRPAWRSPLVWEPARALLVRAVYETAGARGREAVLSLVGGSTPGTLDSLCHRAGVAAAGVEGRYAALADSLARVGEREARMSQPRPWRPGDGFQAGVCLAHAVRLEGGYLSAACGRELAKLRDLGAGWVSITPFGYLPSPVSPEIIPEADAGPDGESDEAVCEAAARARALGLRVWLSPHLWTRGFVGNVEFGPQGWTRFFDRYREFILHYALLAQRERIDGLVVGHELTSAALGHPDRWRALIAEVRRVYGGTLTYGANWGEEVRGIRFWDALDVVGVSFYTPLADAPSHDVPALAARARKGLAELKAVGARAGRPVLIVEAGYAPRSAAAVQPWEERGGSRDLEAQRACYEALVRALEPETWIAGVFWWKWFSSDAVGGAGDGSYTPRGKPAERVMTRAFAEWVGRPVTVPRATGSPRGAPAPP
jgi:hypothetical protein